MAGCSKILILVIGLFFSAFTFSQVIWQKAEKGMTVTQVKKIFSKAVAIQPTEGTTLGDGALRLLELPDYEVNGFKFDAYFYFKAGKLIQVNLVAKDDYPELVYEKMVEAFRMKYKREVSTRSLGIGDESKFWITPDKTEVRVMYMSGKTSIIYSARMNIELNKL